MSDQLPTEVRPGYRLLTAAEFHQLADVPPEIDHRRTRPEDSPTFKVCYQ